MRNLEQLQAHDNPRITEQHPLDLASRDGCRALAFAESVEAPDPQSSSTGDAPRMPDQLTASTNFSLLDWLIVLTFLTGSAVAGIWSRRYVRNLALWLGGRAADIQRAT